MKKIFNKSGYVFFLLLFFTSYSPKNLIAQERITIRDCYRWARDNYPAVKQFGLIDKTEQYNLSNAAKNWLPQLSMSAKATYQSEVTKLPFDTEKITSILPGFDMPVVSKDQYQVAAELSQTIWDGGKTASARSFTKAESALNREQLESDLYVLNERVNQLYFGSLLQHELLNQNLLLQKELNINLERILSLIDNGMANQSDKESLEVEILRTRQNEIEIKASEKEYRLMLSALTGKALNHVVLEKPVDPDMIHKSIINRPELKVFEARSRLMDEQNKQLNAGWMPRIGAFIQGGYGRPGLNMLEDSFSPFYIAGLRFSWNLSRFYTLKNDRRKIETGLLQTDVQRETFLFNTRLQMMQQDAEIHKLKEVLQSDEDIIRLRTSIKQAAEIKLENGVISVSDLIREINAQDIAIQTATTRRLQYMMAVYTYLYITNNKE